MSKILKLTLIILFFCFGCKKADPIEQLLPALAQVESGGNPRAVGDGKKAVGLYQIWPIYVADVNRIAGKKYTLADRYDPIESAQMVRIYLKHYGRGKSIIDMARIHCGGPNGHRKEATKKYGEKVKKVLLNMEIL